MLPQGASWVSAAAARDKDKSNLLNAEKRALLYPRLTWNEFLCGKKVGSSHGFELLGFGGRHWGWNGGVSPGETTALNDQPLLTHRKM